MESGIFRFSVRQGRFTARLVDAVLRNRPIPALNPFLFGRATDTKGFREFAIDGGAELFVRLAGEGGIAGPTDKAAEQDFSFGRSAREYRGREEAPEDLTLFVPRDEIPETIERMGDGRAVVAASDDGHGWRFRPLPFPESFL